jgi:hypothetical protein
MQMQNNSSKMNLSHCVEFSTFGQGLFAWQKTHSNARDGKNIYWVMTTVTIYGPEADITSVLERTHLLSTG